MMKRRKLWLLRFIILPWSYGMFAGFPLLLRAQVSHMDSALAVQLRTELSRQTGGKPFALAADSGLQKFLSVMPHSPASMIAQISALSATITERDFMASSDARPTRILLNANGNFLMPGNPLGNPWSVGRSYDIVLTPADRTLLETNRDRYVVLVQEPAPSFWSSVAEPALVVLGAIAMIALFFLIRS